MRHQGIRIVNPDNRRSGIGKRLLKDFLQWCYETGQPQARGSITASDLSEQPCLPYWYANAAFEAGAPDNECINGTVLLVVWRRGEVRS
jgi:GNAT superfamily N-acetyltransferase